MAQSDIHWWLIPRPNQFLSLQQVINPSNILNFLQILAGRADGEYWNSSACES